MKNQNFSVQTKYSPHFENIFGDALYHIFLFEGKGKIIIDFVEYEFERKTVFFTSPYQNI